MGNCLWMAFLINKQILVVSYQWCLKHIVLIYIGASSHVPSLMFLTAWCPFWPHQCAHHIQCSLHLLEKYARYSGLAFQCWKRWAYSLFCSPLWKTSSFSPPQREKGPGLGAGWWAACDLQSLSGRAWEGTPSGSGARKEGEKGDWGGSEEVARVLKGLHLPPVLLWMSSASQNQFEEQYQFR